jgi:hypothetical protein
VILVFCCAIAGAAKAVAAAPASAPFFIKERRSIYILPDINAARSLNSPRAVQASQQSKHGYRPADKHPRQELIAGKPAISGFFRRPLRYFICN